ncbi:hypothetical protein [Oceanobacillus senegalensis]|uniref:hypothetical protein n=1 Tax=Oceanobacillus senegalensis TaxID=1936063 RepID=UPI001C4E9CF8|nr:hypothetical protein [Oceanobacillus senegalensis]
MSNQGDVLMGKKKRGHYCKACGRFRPNEKFSGKVIVSIFVKIAKGRVEKRKSHR